MEQTPLMAGAESADRVDMKEQWRDGLTRLQKLEASLVARLPEGWPRHMKESYVGGVLRYLTGAWGELKGEEETI